MSKTTTTAESDAAAEPRSNSKIASVLELLRRPDGAALDELTVVTGWQKHTARAALTGLKKQGHTIERTKEGAVSRYRITGAANQ